MKDQRVVGKRKNNPIAKQLSDPLWKMKVVESKVLYNRKIKHKRSSNVDYNKGHATRNALINNAKCEHQFFSVSR